MSSINFNSAATQALRTLQTSNAQLDATQKRISTGLAIGEAKDNAAYWSISTSLKSDTKAMATVKDALGLGAATVDTAYQGLNAAKDVLNEIKSKLTAATQAGVDRDVIQAEVTELQKQLVSIANSASFSGENWLSVDSSVTGFNSMKSVVSSFNRAANGAATIGTIDVGIGNVKLYDSNGNTGLLDAVQNATGFTLAAAGTATADAADIVFAANSSAGFTVTQGGVTKTVTIDLAMTASAGLAGGVVNSNAELESLYNTALNKSGVSGVTASISNTGVVSFKSSSAFTLTLGTVTAGTGTKVTTADLGLGGTLGAAAGGAVLTAKSVATMDISKAAFDAAGVDTAAEIKLQLESYISIVNQTITKVTSAASNLGAIATRIDLQKDFVSTLMDTIDKGVSGLVDADMNEESTKLQALQVKQQLGVQALSIANQSAQSVLRLFQ